MQLSPPASSLLVSTSLCTVHMHMHSLSPQVYAQYMLGERRFKLLIIISQCMATSVAVAHAAVAWTKD